MPMATVITMAACQPRSGSLTATAAMAGTKTSRTKTAKTPNCGARIGTDATQKV